MNFHVFSIARIPVHISVWALLLIGWLAFRGGDPISGAMIGVGLLVSVLIHEFGHAIFAARYGLQPSILLHALGGVTQHARAKSDRQDAIIIAAGPLIQLGVGGVVLVGSLAASVVAPDLMSNLYLTSFLTGFLYVSLFWGLINLAPMWPMDGGKLFRLGLLHLGKLKPARSDRITHITGIATAVIAILLFWWAGGGSFLILIFLIFGMIIYQNIMALREQRSAGPVRPQGKHARSLLSDARDAFERGDWSEAARLGHQIRAEPHVSDKMMSEVFEIIAVAHIFDGQLEEGVRFGRRAPPTPRVIAARVRALHELDRTDEARELLADHEGALPEDLHEELRARLG